MGPLVAAAAALVGMSPASGENRLSDHPSPHIRQHAGGPVDWHVWGDASLAKAAAEGKLVFASLGYAACHWCAEMNRKSFMDEGTAAFLNRNFICIKIDRLERPDLDLTFRTYAQATGNSVAWPLNVWLTPSGIPVSISSYLGDDGYGKSNDKFLAILKHIAKQWQKHPEYLKEQSVRDIVEITGKLQRKPFEDFELPEPDATRREFYSAASTHFDPVFGGFDTGVKFPRPELIETLVVAQRKERAASFKHKQYAKMLGRTLDGILAGAIVDPLDGGMFRYSNDARWRVPQFERLSVDQGRTGAALLEAYQSTGDASYAHAARRMLEFANRHLRAADGTYYSSFAADSQAGEGGENRLGHYYLWHAGELAELLDDDEMAAASAAFGIREGGNTTAVAELQGIGRKANILYAKKPAAHAPPEGSPLASAVAKMLDARSRRPAPFRNEMVIASWNGMMISALARASDILGDPEYLSQATATAAAVKAGLFDSEKRQLARGQVDGTRLGPGYSEDYIFLARGFIDLYRAGGPAGALQTAIELQSIADEQFLAPSAGLYHFTPTTHVASAPLPLWAISDADLPSVNGTAALNQLDLAAIDGSAERLAKVAALLRASRTESQERPTQVPTIIRACLRYPADPILAVVSGPPDDPATAALLAASRRHAPRGVIVLSMDGGDRERAILALRPEFAPFRSTGDSPKLLLGTRPGEVETISTPSAVAAAMAELGAG